MKILLVDDDRDLVAVIIFLLHRAGFEVLSAFDIPTALKSLEEHMPDLAVLDINLGSGNGFELLKTLRQRSQIPVIMLTGRDSEDDKVRALELGADDYVTKPFAYREFVARVRAHLRRQSEDWAVPKPVAEILQVGPIIMNTAQHKVEKDGKVVDLTVTEFRLLHYLMLHAGAVVPVRAILRQVWGYDDAAGTDVVRVTMYRLRRKLGDNSANPQMIHTVPGVGVMLKSETK